MTNYIVDTHDHPVRDEVWDLYEAALRALRPGLDHDRARRRHPAARRHAGRAGPRPRPGAEGCWGRRRRCGLQRRRRPPEVDAVQCQTEASLEAQGLSGPLPARHPRGRRRDPGRHPRRSARDEDQSARHLSRRLCAAADRRHRQRSRAAAAPISARSSFGDMARAYIASLPLAPPQRALVRAQAARVPAHDRALFRPARCCPSWRRWSARSTTPSTAPTRPCCRMTDLAAIPPEQWGRALLRAPSHGARVSTSAPMSRRSGRRSKPARSRRRARVARTPRASLVWRHGTTSMFRELSAEEAMMWDETAKGARFGDLCEMLATYDDPPSAPARAAGFLKAWLDAGLLSEVVLPRLSRLNGLVPPRLPRPPAHRRTARRPPSRRCSRSSSR